MSKKPLTIREHQQKKEIEAKRNRDTVTIMNISQKQRITINVKHAKNTEFYTGSQDIHLMPGSSHTFPKHRLWSSQISRLCKRRLIRIIADSTKQELAKERLLERAEVRKQEDAILNEEDLPFDEEEALDPADIWPDEDLSVEEEAKEKAEGLFSTTDEVKESAEGHKFASDVDDENSPFEENDAE